MHRIKNRIAEMVDWQFRVTRWKTIHHYIIKFKISATFE